MALHFLLSAAARSLSPGNVMRMSERGAENVFVRLRWPQTNGFFYAKVRKATWAAVTVQAQDIHAGGERIHSGNPLSGSNRNTGFRTQLRNMLFCIFPWMPSRRTVVPNSRVLGTPTSVDGGDTFSLAGGTLSKTEGL
jgi:hypothetical protein